MTHAHQDHLGGLTAILDNFQVRKLWIGQEVSSVALARLEQLAKNRKLPIGDEFRGKSLDWDGVQGEFLWPESTLAKIPNQNQNDEKQ